MKKNRALIILLALVLLCQALSFMVFATDAESEIIVLNGCKSLDAEKSLLGNEQFVNNADSVILYETTSQTLMNAWNADQRMDPTSLVKIMTALIVVERGTLTDAVTVSGEALSDIDADAATVDLQIDEVLTVEQLLHCMLVSSANDAAAVLADYVSGSQAAFVELMNTYAEDLGCANTHFTNVHGLYDEEQYSTARDLAKILEAALKQDDFRRIFGTTSYTIPATNKWDVRYLSTGNYLMSMSDVWAYYDGRVTGGRTGMTTAGYRSLATVAQSGNMELICILMGAESVIDERGHTVVFGGYQETSDMLSKGFNGMQLTQVIREDQVLTQKSVANGECDVVLGPVGSAFAVLPTDVRIDDLEYSFTELKVLEAPVNKGDIVASVEIWHENICVAQTDLYAMNSVEVLQTESVEEKAENSSNRSVFWIIIAVVVGVLLLVFALRIVRGIIRNKRSARNRQYRRNRRRSR